jgi:hypothetical protein
LGVGEPEDVGERIDCHVRTIAQLMRPFKY